MPIASALHFRLLLGLAKQIIFAVDKIPFAIRLPYRLARLLPDVWRTSETIRNLKMPVLIMHSTGDALFPVAMAKDIHASATAAGVAAELHILENHPHNAPYLTVPEDYWAAILSFIARTSELECSHGTRRDQ